MTTKDLERIFKKLYEKKYSIIEKKNHDYAKNDDCFSNFKLASIISNIPVEKVFMSIIGIKIARILELLENKNPKNESLEDSLIDIGNYIDLLTIWVEYTKE